MNIRFKIFGAEWAEIDDNLDDLIAEEVAAAAEKHGQFNSSHEGFGVLIEEVTELQEAIHKNSALDIIAEAIQVAAVAKRIAGAICTEAVRKRSEIRGSGNE